MDVEEISRETGVDRESIRVLADAGLEMEQLVALLKDPATALSWSTEFETSDNVAVDEEGDVTLLTAEDSGIRPLAAGQRYCGWAVTKHDGSAWAIRCARLNLRTDWCWDEHSILSHSIQHSVSTTAYGNAGGWRVDPSVEGSSGWISSPDRFRTEVKANWRLVLPNGTQVQSGTAFARHLITSQGRVTKEQGGWPH